MKTAKILLSVLLAVAMFLSFGSFAALAEGSPVVIMKADGSTIEAAGLREAIQAAEAGDTVKLNEDAAIDGTLVIEKKLTIDLGDNTLTLTASGKLDAAILVKDAEVKIQRGTIKIKAANEESGYAVAVLADEGADVTLDILTLKHECETMLAARNDSCILAWDGSYSSDPTGFLPENYSVKLEDGMYVVAETETETDPDTDPNAGEGGENDQPGEGENDQPQDGENDQPQDGENDQPQDGENDQPKEGENDQPKEGENDQPEAGEGDTKDPEPAETGTVTAPDGSAAATMNYYKGNKSYAGLGGDKTFKVSHEPEKLVVGSTGKELHFTYTAGESGGTMVIDEAGNKAVLDALDAGAYTVEVKFKDAKTAELKLNVYMDISLDTNKHVKGSTTPIVVTATDVPENVIISDKSDMSGYKVLTAGTDYTISGTVITLTPTFLDSLGNNETSVSKYIGFQILYNGKGVAVANKITILPPPSIDPTSVTWKRNAEKSFTVKPDVVSVSIDGKEVSKDLYTVSGKTLTFPKGKAIADLTYGEHTLTVETTSGPVSAKITIEPSLGYSSTTGYKHTKGGSKTLIFIASDPVAKVKVDGKELSADQYTLSADKTTITLKAAYLNTLAVKKYTITATVTAGDSQAEVSSSFEIISGAAAGGSPQTGDTSGALWLALLIASCIALAALLPRLRRE